LPVIKEVRNILGLGLREAKVAVEDSSDDNPIKKGVSKEEAEDLKSRLEAVGAEVKIK